MNSFPHVNSSAYEVLDRNFSSLLNGLSFLLSVKVVGERLRVVLLELINVFSVKHASPHGLDEGNLGEEFALLLIHLVLG